MTEIINGIDFPEENQVKCKCGSVDFHRIFETWRVPVTYQGMLDGANTIDKARIVCVGCGEPQEMEILKDKEKSDALAAVKDDTTPKIT